MKRKFIVDKEVDLNESDFLRTKPYADNLVRIIKNTEENKVFTIGLFGSWGSGKSSIIETAAKGFDQSKVKFISYDAWQYANDSFRRMFLRKIRKELCFSETELMKKFYENESADIDNKFNLSTTKVAWTLFAAVIIVAIIWLVPSRWIELDFKFPLYSIISILCLLIGIISGSFHQLKISITKPLFFAPEQFEDCFKQMISKSLKKYTWIEERAFVAFGVKTVRNLEKLVIVIDNIDRCNNDVAYQLLTDVKTFLASDNYSIVFIIPVDDEALRKHLFRINNHNDEDISVKEKEEFLRKFFNVTLRIKPYLETDMFSFTRNINDKYKLGLKVDTLNLAAKEYSTNPRRVIQLLNNLMSELSNYDDEFVLKYETLICAVIILREEFSFYYKEVVNSPRVFLEESIISDIDSNKMNRINRFNRITRNVKVGVKPNVLNFILTNSNSQFDDLSAELKDAIETFDLIKVSEEIKTNADRVFDFIAHSSRNAIVNNLDNDTNSYFDLIAQLSQIAEIERPDNSRLYEIFEPRINYIVEHSSDYLSLCKYADLLERQNLTKLKEFLFEKLTTTNQKLPFWSNLFISALKIYTDEISSKKMALVFSQNYKDINADFKYSSAQYLFLITDAFLNERIDEIDSLISADVKFIKLIDFISNKNNISPETIEKVLSKINELFGISFNKELDEMIQVVLFINEVLNVVPDKLLLIEHDSLEVLYEKILERKIQSKSFPNHRNHDVTVNLIEEGLDDEDFANSCIELVLNIYRVSGGRVDVSDSIYKLSNYRHTIYPIFLSLLDSGFQLKPFWKFIYEDEDYSSKMLLPILKHSIISSEGLKDYVEILPNKIDSLIVYADTNKNNEVYNLIEELSSIEFCKKYIIESIVSKSSVFINQQPKFLLHLAIKSFNASTYTDYSNNYSFLEAVAMNGDQTQKHYLILLLNRKTDTYNKLKEVFPIISHLKNPKITDERLLKSHLESILDDNQDKITDSEKTELVKLIQNIGV